MFVRGCARLRFMIYGLVATALLNSVVVAAAPPSLKLLFLGDNGHHQPAVRFKQLQPVLKKRKIDLTYSDVMSDLNPQTLKAYDGLILYANIDSIADDQAKALLDFVVAGKGFIPLHCASFCFRNNDDVVALMGGQFLRHGTGTFRTIVTEPEHPVMKGFKPFESWDETYVHTRHNEKDRTVLEVRAEGESKEPWTWVRTQGKGRVFYTAWGHDARTWSNPGFQNLVERGIRWACGGDPSVVPAFADRPEMTSLPNDLKPFEYVETDGIPFYPPGKNWGTLESGKRKMQLPATPEESLKHFVTPKGFEVKLFASEKNFQGKPIAMNWDERGRLWICETFDYPNELQPPGKGRDRILICEDTNGDWVADKFSMFAEKLSIPTAITFYRGGVIVQDGTETLYLKDTDGDDKADLRKVLITGWNMRDTHGEVSNFQYGLDNWYYAMQGYNDSRPVLTNGKEATPFRQGFFRFKVEGEGDKTAVTEVEFLRSTNNNTWGLGLSEEGIVFGSTANGNPSEFMPIPNRYYEAVRGWSSSVLGGIADSNKFEPLDEDKVRQVDHHGGFTAAAGHALYTARNYPKEYWNRAAFVTEATGHLIATFIIREDGAGFRSKNSWNLVASNDEWSGPIMAEVGPDGNVWIIDWYNFIIQHNPTPAGFKTGKGNAYESELRDKKHGRIYRLVYTGKGVEGSAETVTLQPNNLNPDADAPAMMARPTDLAKANTEQLIAELGVGNFLWRRHAQRLIVEKDRFDGVQTLIELINQQAMDEIGLNGEITHAMWALHGRGVLDGENRDALKAVVGALRHPSAGVRRNVVQVLPKSEASVSAIVQSGVLKDKNAQVQLMALLALADMPPSSDAAEAIRVAFVAASSDRLLADAAIAAAARHDIHFLKSVVKNSGKGDSPSPEALAIIAEHYARGLPAETAPALVASLGIAKPEIVEPVLSGMAKGWPRNKPLELSEASDKALVELLGKIPASTRGALINLSLRWGSKQLQAHVVEISKSFLDIVQNDKAAEADRVAAARQLVEFRKSDAETSQSLLNLMTPKSSVELANGLLAAVGLSEAPEVGEAIVNSLASMTPSVRPAAVRLLLGRTDWTRALLDGVEGGRLQLTELSLEQKLALSNHVDKAIRDRVKPLLAKGGGLPNPDRQKVVDDLMPLTEKTGDAVAGKAVFKKTCVKCHTHSGEGTRIGPDLTGMAVHPKKELLTHIIDPSRSVEGNFRIYSVTTDDGKVYSGLLASESKTAIELIDVEAKKHQILRENIDELVASPKSLMPEGFEKQHTQQELTDLLEFLTQRGRFLPIPIEKVATAISTKPMFHDGEHDEQKLIFSDWTPKIFEGVPFVLVDPHGDRVPNAIMLHGTNGDKPPRMPKSVTLTCNAPAKLIHFLGGISGWGAPASSPRTPTLTVRLKYADGQIEDHVTRNGEVWADYIHRVDVPGSKFAYPLRGQQIRYFAITPKRADKIESIELVKGNDVTSPIIMAVTIESP
ncbi:MAG: Trehalose utilization [Schlesneria sp.]|nr:Trehalose utilization [Schlesneria sp.]